MKYILLSALSCLLLLFCTACPVETGHQQPGPGDDAGINGGETDTTGGGDELQPTEISFPEERFAVKVGGIRTPEADVVDQHGDTMDGEAIFWESADDSIIEISSGGVAIGHELGTTELIATSGDLDARWPADVVSAVAGEVSVIPTTVNLFVGQQLLYAVNLRDDAGFPIESDRPVQWSTADSAIASVDDDGLVVGVSPGQTEVIAVVDGVEGRADLTVTAVNIDALRISPSSPPTMVIGDELQLTAIATDVDGDEIDDVAAQWSSSDPDVATVDAQGLVVAKDQGSTTIAATIDDLEATVDIDAIFIVTNIHSGGGFSCAQAIGQLFCFGENDEGQLGDGSFESRDDAQPILFSGDVEDVSLGVSHGCLIDGDGEIWCWGNNDAGQLGQPAGASESEPVALGVGETFVDVSAGLDHTCAVTDTDDVYCWGENGDDQLGNGGSSTSIPALVSTSVDFVSVVAGHGHSCAIAADETGYCWGANDRLQLGGGTSNASSAQPLEIVGGYDFSAMSAGAEFTCSTAAGGPPVCWGANDRGQHGNGNTSDQDIPLTLSLAPGDSFNTISAGDLHACGLVPGGEIQCWGAADDGRLGVNTADDQLTPEPIDSTTLFSEFSTGSAHSCARTPDHEVWCWGQNPGDGATPVEIDFTY